MHPGQHKNTGGGEQDVRYPGSDYGMKGAGMAQRKTKGKDYPVGKTNKYTETKAQGKSCSPACSEGKGDPDQNNEANKKHTNSFHRYSLPM